MKKLISIFVLSMIGVQVGIAQAALQPDSTATIYKSGLSSVRVAQDSKTAMELVQKYNERDVVAEFIIVDDDDLGLKVEELSYSELFGPGGVTEIFGSNFDVAGPGKKGRCYKKGKCVIKNGEASYYGPGFGRDAITACGEAFDPNDEDDLTAAHRTLPFGSLVRVTYKGNSIVVRINDRGPFAKDKKGHDRVIDLTAAAMEELGLPHIGQVKLEVVQCGG